MHETAEELRGLQRLLDDSHTRAGAHLRSILSDERRLRAHELAGLLTGVQILSVATVTAKCEPRVAPVDGLFFHARFWFGSSHESVRFRHLRRRPEVSAAHVRGEQLAVIVHGRAVEVDLSDSTQREFRGYLLDVYGAEWEDWGGSAPYARIEPETMFAAWLPGGSREAS
jgi:hypothetical protein